MRRSTVDNFIFYLLIGRQVSASASHSIIYKARKECGRKPWKIRVPKLMKQMMKHRNEFSACVILV